MSRSDNLLAGMEKAVNNMQASDISPKKTTNPIMKMLTENIDAALMALGGDRATAELYIREIVTAWSLEDELQKCDPKSFIKVMVDAAQLRLRPNKHLGEACIIPRNMSRRNKNGAWETVLEATFQPMYKGELTLYWRSGLAKRIKVEEVRENDDYVYEEYYDVERDRLALKYLFRKAPFGTPRGKVKGYFAMIHLQTGGHAHAEADVTELEDMVFFRNPDGSFKTYTDDKGKKHRAMRHPYKSPRWEDDFDAMAKKTVLLRALNHAPHETHDPKNSNLIRQAQAIEYENSVEEYSELPIVDAGFEVHSEKSEIEETPQLPNPTNTKEIK